MERQIRELFLDPQETLTLTPKSTLPPLLTAPILLTSSDSGLRPTFQVFPKAVFTTHLTPVVDILLLWPSISKESVSQKPYTITLSTLSNNLLLVLISPLYVKVLLVVYADYRRAAITTRIFSRVVRTFLSSESTFLVIRTETRFTYPLLTLLPNLYKEVDAISLFKCLTRLNQTLKILFLAPCFGSHSVELLTTTLLLTQQPCFSS